MFIQFVPIFAELNPLENIVKNEVIVALLVHTRGLRRLSSSVKI